MEVGIDWHGPDASVDSGMAEFTLTRTISPRPRGCTNRDGPAAHEIIPAITG